MTDKPTNDALSGFTTYELLVRAARRCDIAGDSGSADALRDVATRTARWSSAKPFRLTVRNNGDKDTASVLVDPYATSRTYRIQHRGHMVDLRFINDDVFPLTVVTEDALFSFSPTEDTALPTDMPRRLAEEAVAVRAARTAGGDEFGAQIAVNDAINAIASGDIGKMRAALQKIKESRP